MAAAVITRLIFISLCAFSVHYCSAARKIGSGGSGYIDLTQDYMNGPGVGFLFQDSHSMQDAKDLVISELPDCEVGPLDSIYFYLYGCIVPSKFVVTLASTVSGFMFTSDKSITMEGDVSNTSLLLANAWNMNLYYSSGSLCEEDFEVITNSKGCAATNSCGNTNSSIEVGCGSLTCTGCVLEKFFQNYTFDNASFELQQTNE
jgi:hypothetical protein